MLQKKLVMAILGAAVVLGVATGAVAAQLEERSGSDPTSSPDPTVAATEPVEETAGADVGGDQMEPPADLFTPEEMTIGPGSLGPVNIGMSKDEALATGYFVADAVPAVNGCVPLPLAWRDEYVHTFDVQTAGNGEILSMGVYQSGPTTGAGYGVGSTWGELKGWLDDPQEAGFGQSGAFRYDARTAGWIGFLFDTPLDQLADDDVASFVEVTRGGQPDLMRSGC